VKVTGSALIVDGGMDRSVGCYDSNVLLRRRCQGTACKRRFRDLLYSSSPLSCNTLGLAQSSSSWLMYQLLSLDSVVTDPSQVPLMCAGVGCLVVCSQCVCMLMCVCVCVCVCGVCWLMHVCRWFDVCLLVAHLTLLVHILLSLLVVVFFVFLVLHLGLCSCCC
jgi:hypothetical protein